MKLYLAGIYTSNFNIGGRIFERLTDSEKEMRLSATNLLESHHYIHRQSFVDKIRNDGKTVFLDSGAFSAFTQGIEVNMEGYCEYCRTNADIIHVASVLDGIGDPLKTYQNQMKMHELGVNALPCFHYGEDERYLDFYIEHYDYITLGGMVPISTPQLKLWLDRLWEDHLTHPDGTPKIKVHGFGLTSLPLMVRYPWYSVDSSTWVQWAANGMLLVPGIGQVNMSEKSSSRKIEGQHFDNYPKMQQDAIRGIIEGFGGDVERLRSEYIARWAWNIWAFPYWVRDKEYEGDKFIGDQMRFF